MPYSNAYAPVRHRNEEGIVTSGMTILKRVCSCKTSDAEHICLETHIDIRHQAQGSRQSVETRMHT